MEGKHSQNLGADGCKRSLGREARSPPQAGNGTQLCSQWPSWLPCLQEKGLLLTGRQSGFIV